jgi:hypothetical protein
MIGWDLWKKGFYAWAQATADYFEAVLKNPAVLGPAGAFLTAAMKTKTARDRAAAAWWGAMGLPTKRDQERALHKLNVLESRLFDLEERLEDSFDAERRH